MAGYELTSIGSDAKGAEFFPKIDETETFEDSDSGFTATIDGSFTDTPCLLMGGDFGNSTDSTVITQSTNVSVDGVSVSSFNDIGLTYVEDSIDYSLEVRSEAESYNVYIEINYYPIG